MKRVLTKNSGITLVALVLTVIIMTIIASIAVYEGKEIITKSKIQTLETNMLTIQAKAKAYAEEIDAKVWALGDDKEDKRTGAFKKKGLERENDSSLEYTVTDDGLVMMGLGDLKRKNGDEFTVIYSNDYKSIDVKFVNGISYKNVPYYNLSEIQGILKDN